MYHNYFVVVVSFTLFKIFFILYWLLLLLLSPFSQVRLCATPMDSSPPGSSVHRIL